MGQNGQNDKISFLKTRKKYGFLTISVHNSTLTKKNPHYTKTTNKKLDHQAASIPRSHIALAPGGGKMRDPGNEVDYQDVLLQDDAREHAISSLVSGEHFSFTIPNRQLLTCKFNYIKEVSREGLLSCLCRSQLVI